MITSFQRQENLVLGPIVLLIASLQLRGLLPGTVEDILTRASSHPARRIEIGSPEDAHKPVLCHLEKNGRYKYNTSPATGRSMSKAVAEICLTAGVLDVPGDCGHALRRGKSMDLRRVSEDQWQAGRSAQVSSLFRHSRNTSDSK